MTIVIGLCASVMGLASISMVKSAADPRMVLPTLAVESLPYWMGAMVFIGVLGASMSTANGAMLVISVVLARNVFQRWSKTERPDSFMLSLSRTMAIPTAAAAALVAYVWPEPGILLIVAFDIVFAGCVAPLFGGVYWSKANGVGAIWAVIVGTGARVVAHFATPPAWAGLDTLAPPVLSGLTFYFVCSATWKQAPSRHHVIAEGGGEGLLAEG
jgi:Na+/proline symporter